MTAKRVLLPKQFSWERFALRKLPAGCFARQDVTNFNISHPHLVIRQGPPQNMAESKDIFNKSVIFLLWNPAPICHILNLKERSETHGRQAQDHSSRLHLLHA